MIELKNINLEYCSGEGFENGAAGGVGEIISNGSLKDINLTINDGEFVLLTGGSGCGKTSLLRLINGLIPNFYDGKLTGSVSVNGQDVSHAELYDTAKIVSTVFQNPRSQFFNVDTTNELAFACENQGMAEEEILKRMDVVIEKFHLQPLMDRSLFNLSGGQKQKIACASVAVTGNQIILLDEPSANLDQATMDDLHDLLKQWKSEGKTLVVAEHRIAYLWDLLDRAVILKEGQIVQEMSRSQMDEATEESLHALGLRSNEDCRDCRVKPDNDTGTAPTSSSGTESLSSSGTESLSSSGLTRGSSPDAVLQIQNFHYKYKNGLLALNIPQMQIEKGQITAITGNNGEGKTTFLNCLCGLGRRSKGILLYEGKAYKRSARQKLIYLVMQNVNHQLFSESVLDEILISQPEENEDQARQILASLDLAEFADRHPQSLSGGQKQRVAVACAIASGRDIMLFDEPTSGLDYTHMLQIGKILSDLKSMGKTVIVVTHDRELIKECCDQEIHLAEYNTVIDNLQK
ncbi:MAG: energy-coupling factor ABC transporter ATP-binding protein [Treponema sp.]|nr:energy-coupling factor ABC transporter ATP-binding protein [Treponema sp.]